MFERYTEAARRALFFARYETTRLGGTSIETEHLLLGLMREPAGLVDRLFAASNVAMDGVRTELERRAGRGEQLRPEVEIPFSAEMKRVLASAVEEADALGHRHIGPEHLLLGLLREAHSVAGRTLAAQGFRIDAVRDQLPRLLSEPLPRPDPQSSAIAARGQIEAIQTMIDGLARLAGDSAEARNAALAIQIELDTLKRRLGG